MDSKDILKIPHKNIPDEAFILTARTLLSSNYSLNQGKSLQLGDEFSFF